MSFVNRPSEQSEASHLSDPGSASQHSNWCAGMHGDDQR